MGVEKEVQKLVGKWANNEVEKEVQKPIGKQVNNGAE